MSWGAIAGAAISTVGGVMASKSGGGGGAPRWLKQANKSAVSRAEDLSNRAYTRYTGDRVAGLSENEQMASGLARNYGADVQPYLRNMRSDARFRAGALDQYTNPYIAQVLENQRRVIGEEYGRQSADLSRRQSAMDAFRTGRSDLARSRLNRDRMTALGDAEAEGRAGAFDRAMSAYAGDRALMTQANAGALSGFLNSRNSQIGALQSTGRAERGIEQAQMDFDYGQFLEGRDWDVNNFGILLDALRTAQGGSGQGNSAPSTASLLTGLLGTATSNGAFDGLFDKWTGSAPLNTAGDAAAGLSPI